MDYANTTNGSSCTQAEDDVISRDEFENNASRDQIIEEDEALIMNIDKNLDKGENMLPVHFLPEGKKCYDWINEDLENSSTNQMKRSKVKNTITYSSSTMNSESESFNNKTIMLLEAAENDNLDVVINILTESPHVVNLTDKDGYTALHRACYSGHLRIVETLIERNANVHLRTLDGWQPIHCASRWNHIDIAYFLLNNNADVNSKTNGSQTPLHFAALSEDNIKLLEMFLLQPNIDINITNGAGDTAYDLASRNGPQVKLFEMQDDAMKI